MIISKELANLLKSLPQPESYHNGIPVILALSLGGVSVFWCNHCKQVHSHGSMSGHRIAHCFHKGYSNYYLKVLTSDDLKQEVNL